MRLYIQKLQAMDELCAAPLEPQNIDQKRLNALDIMFFNKNPQGSCHDMVKLKTASNINTVLYCFM